MPRSPRAAVESDVIVPGNSLRDKLYCGRQPLKPLVERAPRRNVSNATTVQRIPYHFQELVCLARSKSIYDTLPIMVMIMGSRSGPRAHRLEIKKQCRTSKTHVRDSPLAVSLFSLSKAIYFGEMVHRAL